ncbi:putative nuclease HARBI1 [Eupeodes corollae]|uniref:putative nuclease HARBI1 n=1 Tax=Eupeodes corollae TaxID=290404 RepID=UPI00248FC6B8|nr:putative nuclease HARBI1 [Eupeodes corollae]
MDKAIILREAFSLFFDDEDEEDEYNTVEINSRRIIKNEKYAEEVVPRFSDKTFKQHFRVNPNVFDMLCQELLAMEQHNYGPGRESTDIEKKIMITLWYLGNPECMRSIADRFGVCIANVFRIITSICDNLIQLNRTKRFIKWPNSDEAARTSAHYLRKTRLPGVIGSIDGCHIAIRAPTISPNSYINRKGFHSVLLQGVCNHRLEFTYCYTGEAGSIHDALLLRRSKIIDKINSGQFYIHEEQHLLGDSAYPLKQWLVTPYKDNGRLRDEHKIFNRVHSKCRVSIERAFGLLKGRWRRLFSINSLKPISIVKYIMASCILHNICIAYNDTAENFIILEDDENIDNDREADSIDMQTAQTKRESLMNTLF